MITTSTLMGLILVSGTEPPPAAESWPTLEGRWAFVQVTTAVSHAPLLGKVDTETKVLSLITVRQRASELELGEETVCHLETSSPAPFVHTRYPRAFVRAIGGDSRRARLERLPNGSVRFVQPKTWKVQGTRLEAPVTEALPTEPTDPRVTDDDLDGAPGLTVRVHGLVSGELRIVSRGWTVLDGKVESGAIRGMVTWQSEQKVLEVTNGMLDHDPDPTPHPDPRRSWFGMVRVDGETGCEQLMRHKKKLEAQARPPR